MITGDANERDSIKVLAQLRQELGDELGHALNLFDDVLLIRNLDCVVYFSAYTIAIIEHIAVLAAMPLCNGDNPIEITTHHLAANLWVVCIPSIVDINTIVDIVQRTEQVVVRRSI